MTDKISEKTPLLQTNLPQSGAIQTSSQNPIQVDPVVLGRAMQIISKQMAAQQEVQRANVPLPQVTTQQTLTLSDGRYVGDVQNGEPHGRGTLTYHPGMERKQYEGEWQKGKFHGRGVLKLSNGTRHEGEWADGQQHGKGLTFWPDGNKYEGEYALGYREGKGVYTHSNGDIYDGEWKEGQEHGNGTFRWASSGGVYKGEWKNGNRHGQGRWDSHEGSYFVGAYENGKKHGQGKFYFSYGAYTDIGIYKEDKIWTGKRVLRGYKIGEYKDGVFEVDSYGACCTYCTLT
ncbi:MAG: hypothetical protein JSR58_04010 [Verrucomicrobia bacterium]|nr:hypothetical protein [Verrucomicrobiota bacterium]